MFLDLYYIHLPIIRQSASWLFDIAHREVIANYVTLVPKPYGLAIGLMLE